MSDVPRHPLPLRYAMRTADGLPDHLPEVEAAIDRGVPPRRMRRLFHKQREIGPYIAKSLRDRFDYGQLTFQCICCGVNTNGIVHVRWTFRVPKPLVALSAHDAKDVAESHTAHSLCEHCFDRWQQRVRMWHRLQMTATWTVWLSVIVLMWSAWFGPRDVVTGWWLFLGFGGLSVIGLITRAIGVFFVRRRAPFGLRGAVPSWLTIQGWTGYMARNGR